MYVVHTQVNRAKPSIEHTFDLEESRSVLLLKQPMVNMSVYMSADATHVHLKMLRQ